MDKRIRIILNRRTVLQDTLLAFATLTAEDMDKPIRLQFNGEVGATVLFDRSRAWTRADCRASG